MDKDTDTLERRLEQTFAVEPPPQLRERLLRIPETVPAIDAAAGPRPAPRRSGFFQPLAALLPGFEWRLAFPAFAVIAAVGVLWVAGMRALPEAPVLAGADEAAIAEQQQAEQQQAIRDFVIVMNYLQVATARAHRGVRDEIGTGLMTAFNRGEQSFTELSNEVTNGG